MGRGRKDSGGGRRLRGICLKVEKGKGWKGKNDGSRRVRQCRRKGTERNILEGEGRKR